MSDPISARDPSKPIEPIVEQRCAGSHFFENICNACGHAQPDGPCEICPHIGSQAQCSAEHFARRPCRSCKSPDMRSVRVRATAAG